MQSEQGKLEVPPLNQWVSQASGWLGSSDAEVPILNFLLLWRKFLLAVWVRSEASSLPSPHAFLRHLLEWLLLQSHFYCILHLTIRSWPWVHFAWFFVWMCDPMSSCLDNHYLYRNLKANKLNSSSVMRLFSLVHMARTEELSNMSWVLWNFKFIFAVF